MVSLRQGPARQLATSPFPFFEGHVCVSQTLTVQRDTDLRSQRGKLTSCLPPHQAGLTGQLPSLGSSDHRLRVVKGSWWSCAPGGQRLWVVMGSRWSWGSGGEGLGVVTGFWWSQAPGSHVFWVVKGSGLPWALSGHGLWVITGPSWSWAPGGHRLWLVTGPRWS